MPAILHARPVALAALLLAASPSALAAAQPDKHDLPGHDESHRGAHSGDAGDGDVIVVTGHPPINFGLLAGTASIEGDRLIAETRGQIGETLAKLPGVSSSSFAPGASRPVLRGFDGDRVSVLVDGIGSIDLSGVSADHAVVFDALTVDHIDVLHGPAVLLFGGQAIGGAVNALDKRIPRKVPAAITGTVLGGYGTAADERSLGGALDVPLAPRLVAHLDANWRKSNDVRVGGYVNSAPLRADLLAEAADLRTAGQTQGAAEIEYQAGLSGRLPNSAARSTTLGAGLAFIDSGGSLGVSAQRFDTRYGVPERPGAGDAGEPVSIDLGQTRFDLRGELLTGGLVESLQLRGAYGDYRHVELEGADAGTVFAGKGIEFRADLVQAHRGGWRGRSGVHYVTRSLDVEGPEAIVPDNTVDRIGVFTLQSVELGGGFSVEGAGRYEHVSVRANAIGFARTFDLWSEAAGISFAPDAGWKLGLNYIRGARAPSPDELLSDGLHVATQAYERGDPTFAAETSDGFEAYLRYEGDHAQMSLTGYRTDFGSFIAAIPTGAQIEDFPEFRYTQVSARYTGFEASGRLDAAEWAEGALTLEGSADYTHARLKGIGPVPRIPPLRLRGGAQVRQGAARIHGEVEWNARQSRVAAFENPVPGFTVVNLGADWHPLGEDGPLTLLLSADNLLDAAGRRAASFTREFVPLPGRDIRVTAKVSF